MRRSRARTKRPGSRCRRRCYGCAVANIDRSVLPVHVPWEKRLKSIETMPGGVTNYLESLRWTAQQVREEPIAPEALAARIMNQYAIGGENARLVVAFLKRIGFLRVDSDGCSLAEVMQSWLRDGDTALLMVMLHHKVRLIGEMLEAVGDPMKISELLRWANDRYRTGWKSTMPIDTRVAWLRSAGLMRRDNLHLYRTDAGSAFLDLVVVEPPLDGADDPHQTAVPARPTPSRKELRRADSLPDPESTKQSGPVDELVDWIVSASTDSGNPTEFELAVRGAFGFLGFDAEHLGGSGLTDVLLTARLGRDASYRVAVDAKTSGSGTLTDGQVDWITLGEHRENHAADFSMVIGPNPSGRRLITRAEEQAVAVLSAEELADLCSSHAAQPLALAVYKSLFESGGRADLSGVKHRSNEANRVVALAKRLLNAIGDEAEHLGPRTARDLLGRLYRDAGAPAATESQVRDLLASLASPLVGAIQGDPESGYAPSCSPTVTAERLRILGEVLAAD